MNASTDLTVASMAPAVEINGEGWLILQGRDSMLLDGRPLIAKSSTPIALSAGTHILRTIDGQHTFEFSLKDGDTAIFDVSKAGISRTQ